MPRLHNPQIATLLKLHDHLVQEVCELVDILDEFSEINGEPMMDEMLREWRKKNGGVIQADGSWKLSTKPQSETQQ